MVLKRPLQISNGFWGDHHLWMFFGRSDHCHQWFYDGFLMLLPSLSMVFNGSGPLVKRCDGFDGSLWSSDGDGGVVSVALSLHPRFPRRGQLMMGIHIWLAIKISNNFQTFRLLINTLSPERDGGWSRPATTWIPNFSFGIFLQMFDCITTLT